MELSHLPPWTLFPSDLNGLLTWPLRTTLPSIHLHFPGRDPWITNDLHLCLIISPTHCTLLTLFVCLLKAKPFDLSLTLLFPYRLTLPSDLPLSYTCFLLHDPFLIDDEFGLCFGLCFRVRVNKLPDFTPASCSVLWQGSFSFPTMWSTYHYRLPLNDRECYLAQLTHSNGGSLEDPKRWSSLQYPHIYTLSHRNKEHWHLGETEGKRVS